MVSSSMHESSLAYISVQWSFGAFPLRKPPNRDLEHTIDLRLPRIGKRMGEPHRVAYTSISDLHWGCQQMRAREQVIHRVVPKYYQGFLVMPLGLTNASVTLQSCKQWQRHPLPLFDALTIHSRTWEGHLSQSSEIGSLVAMAEFICLDLVIKIKDAQGESHTLLGWCTEFSTTDIGNGGLPMRWWDPDIHLSDGLFRMRLTIDRVEVVIGLHRGGNRERGVVEFCFSLMIPKIEDSHGLVGVGFTKMSRLSMVHDRDFQGRKAQSEPSGQTMVNGGMRH